MVAAEAVLTAVAWSPRRHSRMASTRSSWASPWTQDAAVSAVRSRCGQPIRRPPWWMHCWVEGGGRAASAVRGEGDGEAGEGERDVVVVVVQDTRRRRV